MRVTTKQMFDNLLLGIRRQQQAQAQGTAQVSSGYKFSRPSDDGLGFKKSVDIRHVQAGIKASLDGLSTAKVRLGASTNALSQILPLLQRAQVLAVQQANPSLGTTERQAAAVEVKTLQDQLLALANQKFEGESLFAGTATSTDAFDTAFTAGVATYTQGANTSITSITQTSNSNAVNDTYTILLNSAGDQITSVKNAAGTEQLAPLPVLLNSGAGAYTLTLNNGAVLSATYNGTPDTVNTAGGTLVVTGANASGTVNYVGNTQDRVAAITSTQTVTSNVRGDKTAFTQAFSSLQSLKDALTANNTTNIKSALTLLNTAGDSMTELTGETGGRLSSITLREQVFQDLKIQMEQRRGQIEDTDLAAVAASLARAQVALQASFSAMARVGSLSLVNFLR